MELRPVWFDSLGAKSMCVLVRTPDLALLIDPGAAIMQPRYPAPDALKAYYLDLATRAIRTAAADATHIAITHYHYDHFRPDIPELFAGKTMWIKDPNRWINRSQWGRARAFLSSLVESMGGEYRERSSAMAEYPDPLDALPLAAQSDRRADLVAKWRRRFLGLTKLWGEGSWVDAAGFAGRIAFADARTFTIGDTTVRFTAPMFHGIEYASPGWVLGVVVEHNGRKLIYSSDLQGPIIEDYAAWIVEEKPDVLILDGPATYLLGPFQSKETLARAIRNCTRTVKEAHASLVILDHHLTREPRFREKLQQAFSAGAITGAELMGIAPLTDRLARWKADGEMDEVIARAGDGTLDHELPAPRWFEV